MECARCGGDDCLQIEIQLKDGDKVSFFSCRRCETKWWEREGGAIALDEVLTLASKRDEK